MDKYSYLLILFIYVAHFMVLTYYQEFLFARQPWFRGEMRTARIEGFGKCKFAFGSRAALEHYTIVSYSIGNQEYIGKISRSVDDQFDRKIVLAVSGKVAARYEKCNCYIGNRHHNGINERGTALCNYYICIYAILQVIALISLMVGCIQHDFRLAKMYLIYILVAILSYVFLKQMIGIRNFMWKKDTGGMKVDENEWRKGLIAFFSMLSLVYSLFMAAAIIICRDVELAFKSIVYIVLFILAIVQLAKKLEEKEDISIPDSKIVLAEVISVDNIHEAKKLICQVKNGQEIMQYQKIQYINFLEKIGDFVEVRVELADEKKYEVLNRIEN
ncbi:MAG: hypothetical protein HDR01_00835 [Lachnospiraceae bacterium]|nr:hypothetical protein [Lachnospiraceae bacterium]